MKTIKNKLFLKIIPFLITKNSDKKESDGGTPLLDKKIKENRIPIIILDLKKLFIK